MKNPKVITGDLDDAVSVFKKELPDPEKSRLSTFKDEFFLNDKKITFVAQKFKSSSVMCWSIHYTS